MPVPAIFYAHRLRIASKVSQSGWATRIHRWRKPLAIFAGDQIRCDRRIKSPGVSPALVIDFYSHQKTIKAVNTLLSVRSSQDKFPQHQTSNFNIKIS